LSWS